MAMNFGKLDFAVSFNRQTAFPLDAKSYFESLTSAQAAAATAQEAGSSDSAYYYGQQIAVVENSVATLYVIQPDKTLKEVGGKVAINENVFVKDSDGSLNLLGFADAVAGAQLVKSADGKVSWVKPDTTTVEGLSASVEALRTDVDNLQTAQTTTEGKVSALETAVGKEAGEGQVATGIFADLADIGTDLQDIYTTIGTKAEGETAATGMQKDIADVAKKASDNETAISGINTKLADIYTKSETNTQISAAVAAAAHLKYKKVTAVGDIDLAAPDADQYIYLVPIADAGETSNNLYDEYMVIEGKLEKVGDWKVDLSDYATVESLNALTTEVGNKVDKVEGKSLVSDTEIAKLAGIAEGAEVNYVKSVEEAQLAVDESGKLSVIGVNQSLVKGVKDKAGSDATLQAALDEKLVQNDLVKYISTDDTLILDCNGVTLE